MNANDNSMHVSCHQVRQSKYDVKFYDVAIIFLNTYLYVFLFSLTNGPLKSTYFHTLNSQ